MRKYTDENYVDELFQKVYPIGSIYMSMVETNPSVLFGFGEWEQIKDTFLLSAGNDYAVGDTGGSENHAHKYGLQYGGYYRHIALEKNVNAGALVYDENGNVTLAVEETLNSYTAPMNSSTAKTMATEDPSMSHYRTIGTSSYVSNLPPYLAVYMWKRVS